MLPLCNLLLHLRALGSGEVVVKPDLVVLADGGHPLPRGAEVRAVHASGVRKLGHVLHAADAAGSRAGAQVSRVPQPHGAVEGRLVQTGAIDEGREAPRAVYLSCIYACRKHGTCT